MRLGKTSASKQDEVTGSEVSLSHAINNKQNEIQEDIGEQAIKGSDSREVENKQNKKVGFIIVPAYCEAPAYGLGTQACLMVDLIWGDGAGVQ